MPTPTNEHLYEDVKKFIMNKYKKNSAFASGAIVKEYKRRGGKYKADNKPAKLKRWFDEKWVDVNPILGVKNAEAYPLFRPTVRVNKDTPLTVQEIPISNLNKQYQLKQRIKDKGQLPDFKEKKGGKLYNPFTPIINYNNPLTPVFEEGKRLIYGNEDYPQKVKKILNKFGNENINKITIVRNPVSTAIVELLNVASFGDFKKKMKEAGYDKLFHLAVVFDTNKGRVLLEKNEVVNMSETIPHKEGFEDRNVDINKNLTINELLKNTENRMGKDLYFKYDASNNNCQNFILNVLKANNLGNENDYEFIKQDTEELFKTNPHLRVLTKKITDLAGVFTGRGKNKPKLTN